MKIVTGLLLLALTYTNLFPTSLKARDSAFFDYQSYNHGYCPQCDSYPRTCINPEENNPLADNISQDPSKQPYPYEDYNQSNSNTVIYESNDSISELGDICPSDCSCQQCCTTGPCSVAPICGAEVGISVAAIGIGMIALGIAATIIVFTTSSSAHN